MSVVESKFGKTAAGETRVFRLENGACVAEVTDYGAILVSFAVRNAEGEYIDIALGYDNAEGYEAGGDFFGATVGRSANRIGGASFVINDEKFEITKNENGNNLHSGPDFYDKRIWAVEDYDASASAVTFVLNSPDGDQGFPGNMVLKVTYELDAEGGLHIIYDAESDKDTVCNPTNHSYFNLNGQGNGQILDHVLTIHADAITATDAESIPTGEFRPVAGTPFDFNEPKEVGREIGDTSNDQIRMANGYDHNYVLSHEQTELRSVASVFAPKTGITMEVLTDLPGIQFYAGNFVKEQAGKAGSSYGARSGLALETQYYPNSINDPKFASPILRAGEQFHSETIYKLSR